MLEESEVICIFKDERHGRLHIRFRCIGERQFFKRLTSEVNAHATPNAADVFAEQLAAVPVMWTPQHAKELAFQQEKHRKKKVLSCLDGHLLATDMNHQLVQSAHAEATRQAFGGISCWQGSLQHMLVLPCHP